MANKSIEMELPSPAKCLKPNDISIIYCLRYPEQMESDYVLKLRLIHYLHINFRRGASLLKTGNISN